MSRYAPLCLLIVATGCAPKPTEPPVVTLPQGLPRPPVSNKVESERKPKQVRPVEGSGTAPKANPVAVAPARDPRQFPAPSVSSIPPSPSPAMPKADETKRLGYKTPGGTALEVEGVCRFDESSIACWDADGHSAEDVRQLIESSLTKQPEYGNLQIRYGMKNRIVVIRQTSVPVVNGVGERRNLSVMTVGSDPRFGSGYVNLQEASTPWKPGEPQVRHEARLFAADKQARETQMRVMMSEPMTREVDLPLQVGGKASLNGCTFRVMSIGNAPPDSAGWVGGSPNARVWSVKLAESGKPDRPASFFPHVKTPTYVDKAGKLVDQNTFMEWQRKRMEAYRTPGPHEYRPEDEPYRMVNVNMRRTVRMSGEETEIVMNVDPKLLGKITMGGSYMRTIDITGIPLDPK